ncbi:alpha/beta hydrolase [Colwellia sp. 1_MG-2023]|uniref:alpha/beta fold hydrolase n=1 Tax=Colwellia sp. 1_MG-2023 TaxID=3062649 RepID=UPI0026E1C52D|nr:alpha/beta hydrolase [Colwellia sp. 1_MG-2023]MDO6446543.1 alpha/beta hydrolase [Colwellia sp. 1_MG-2023]
MRQSIYLLPGTMCDTRLWQPMIASLKKLEVNEIDFHFLTIAPKPTIDGIVDDIKQQLPNEKVTLMGFSLGGYLASALTLKYPQMVKRLLVIANMPCALPANEIKERSRAVAWIKRNGYAGIAQKRILALLDKSAHHRNDIVSLIDKMDKSLGQDVLVHQLLATTKREDIFPKLALLDQKKHFCVGENDPLVSITSLADFQQQDKNMTLAIFKHAGHMLPLEKPDEVANWLTNILVNHP